ncbi:2'-5' RNA ligase family protein [Herbiconiux sp. L3-i23]|uniref:2'-5' RNA ligase family protein n=1 Tax=Herbiconiux sp. L3-i23 TaxID=2905871 RepID=UPI00206B8A35|nr:2'-5' RNA ligase family protein [Herbiconiux sp. L3-i23]BDI22989.1 hypothetical protein L3i23_17650 [Herbiconiux sp. L3-i23]
MNVAEETLFVVVATPDPLPATIDRSRWPAHVTIGGNFAVLAEGETLLPTIVQVALEDIAAFTVSLGGLDYFGDAGRLPVLLAPHESLSRMHNTLADGLVSAPGFRPAEPAYWRHGYRAHLTLAENVELREGDELHIERVALLSLTGSKALRRCQWMLPATLAARPLVP